MSYHLLPVRMSIIKRSTINKCCREYGEKGTLPHWWECELVKLLWETVWRFLKKLKIELQSDPETLFLGIYLEKTNLKRYMCSYVHRLLIFLLPVLIPACDSSSLAFCMMCSAYKLNKQGDSIQLCCTPFPIFNQLLVPCPVLTVTSWPAYKFLRKQVKWSGTPIS